MTQLDISSESFGTAARVADGFWIVATRHRPGGSARMPEINNRCLVFRLMEGDSPTLAVLNAVAEEVIPEVKKIEQETGLAVKYIVSPGGGHHYLMGPWHDAFEQAEVLVPPARVPRTESGKKLLQKPRVKTLDPEKPLPQFAGQLDLVLFSGLYGPPDRRSPGEGGSDGVLAFLAGMFNFMFRMRDPIDELWAYHRATKTVIGGENLGWMFPKASYDQLSGPFKSMITPDAVYIFKDGRKIADAAKVKDYWKRILDWDGDNVMTYHDTPGYARLGGGRAALEQAVTAVGQL